MNTEYLNNIGTKITELIDENRVLKNRIEYMENYPRVPTKEEIASYVSLAGREKSIDLTEIENILVTRLKTFGNAQNNYRTEVELTAAKEILLPLISAHSFDKEYLKDIIKIEMSKALVQFQDEVLDAINNTEIAAEKQRAIDDWNKD
jgi:hypothetical protein